MEKIEDMIILEYLPLQKVRVRCSICGKERIVSLRNLRRKGNRHTINTCKESFVNLLIGKELGDYAVSGSAPKNKKEITKEQFENLCSVTTKGIIVIQEVVGGIPTL